MVGAESVSVAVALSHADTLEISCHSPTRVLLPALESMETKRHTSYRSYSTNVYIQNHWSTSFLTPFLTSQKCPTMSTHQEAIASSTSSLIWGLKEFTTVVEYPTRPWSSLSWFEATPSIQVIRYKNCTLLLLEFHVPVPYTLDLL